MSKHERKAAVVDATGVLKEDLKQLRRGLALRFPPNAHPFQPDMHYVQRMLRLHSRHPEATWGTLCALSNTASRPHLRRIKAQLADALERFMNSTPDDAAFAAFMASELLGDSWPDQSGVSVLLRVLSDGKTPCGRRWAAHGVHDALRRWPRLGASLAGPLLKLMAYETDVQVRLGLRDAILLAMGLEDRRGRTTRRDRPRNSAKPRSSRA